MNTLHDLAQRLMALDDKIMYCMKCGFCQGVCPIFGASGMEADVTRGKLALISNLAHELIQDAEAVADKLGRCLMCGSCQVACPPGVKIMDVFLEARELIYGYIGLNPVKKMIFRILLAKPALFNFAVRVGAPVQNLLFRKTGQVQDTACAPMLNFMLGDRHIRRLAAKPLLTECGSLNEPRSADGLKVAFFPGCMGDKLYTDMSKACLKALRHHKVAIYMPDNLACCGLPALSSGDVQGMLNELKTSLDALSPGDFDYILSPCASCSACIKEHWPHYAARLGTREAEFAGDIAKKSLDINAFFIDVLKIKATQSSADAQSVTYHDSCHLKKSLGVSSQPRSLIAANPSYTLTEMPEADRCCGCGGSFNLFHYDWSRKIGQRKRDNVVSSGAKIVAAACPACMMQLEDVLSHNRDPIRVKHTMELYAESLG